jgi:hypothetical protein
LGTNDVTNPEKIMLKIRDYLQITDDGETSDAFDFGDHPFNETFEANDDAKYDTVPGN